jgi:hypothetical protein
MAEVVIPMAEVVSRPDDRLAQPAPWDLLSPTALPSSNVVLTPVPSQQPPRKKPVAQRKSKREREADSDRLSRFFGGLICAFFGLVMVVGAVLLSEHLRVKHNLRWGGTRWLGRVGVLTIILGIGVTLSSFRKE